MARFKGGRPKSGGESTPGTKQVRLFDDLAEMITWICRLNDTSSAQLVDPLLRPQITLRYARISKDVERIKALEEQAREAERAAQQSAAEGEPAKKKKGREG